MLGSATDCVTLERPPAVPAGMQSWNEHSHRHAGKEVMAMMSLMLTTSHTPVLPAFFSHQSLRPATMSFSAASELRFCCGRLFASASNA